MSRRILYLVAIGALVSCVRVKVGSPSQPVQSSEQRGTIAQVFYWRAKTGMLDAYNIATSPTSRSRSTAMPSSMARS
jgi:hypothetical protein